MLGPGIPVAKQFGIAHLVAQWKKLEWIYVWVDTVYGFKSRWSSERRHRGIAGSRVDTVYMANSTDGCLICGDADLD